jgi:phosphate/sulfate permease
MMDIDLYSGDEGRVLVMAGMTSVLLAAATWLLVASKYGLPVSTTHSAVGGVIAFAVASKGYGSVKWSQVGMIVASWFISPTLSAIIGFVMYASLYALVLKHDDSLRRAKIAAPFLVFLMTFVLAMFTIYKGAKGIGLNKTGPGVAIGISFAISALAGGLSYPFVIWWGKQIAAREAALKLASEQEAAQEPEKNQVERQPEKPAAKIADSDPDLVITNSGEDGTDKIQVHVKEGDGQTATTDGEPPVEAPWSETERLFQSFVVIVAAFQSIAHGANDVANSVGPFGAVLAASQGELGKKTSIPIWVFFVAGFCIVVGLAMYGVKVMQTIGNNITPVTPSKAFCAQWAATSVVLLATRLGIPISTTHAAVGGVLGVGLAEGVQNIRWGVMAKVFTSWIVTLPIVGITAAGAYGFFLPAVLETA